MVDKYWRRKPIKKFNIDQTMYSLVTDEAKNDLDLNAAYPTFQQAFNWINEEKIKLTKKHLRYKKRKVKKTSMMNHTRWDSNNKTVLPISLGPKYINKRYELDHLETYSILGKGNEYNSIISIVDRWSKRVWLIKAKYKALDKALKNEPEEEKRKQLLKNYHDKVLI